MIIKDELFFIFMFLLTIMILCILIGSLSGCGFIDFRGKGIAIESKVVGINAEVPSITTGNALCKVQFGYIFTKYASAPDSCRVTMEDNYENVSLLSLSGTTHSKITVENNADTEFKK